MITTEYEKKVCILQYISAAQILLVRFFFQLKQLKNYFVCGSFKNVWNNMYLRKAGKHTSQNIVINTTKTMISEQIIMKEGQYIISELWKRKTYFISSIECLMASFQFENMGTSFCGWGDGSFWSGKHNSVPTVWASFTSSGVTTARKKKKIFLEFRKI